MVTAYLSYQFAGLLPLVSYFGTGGIIVCACVALWMFTPALLSKMFPNIQKTLLWVAAIIVAVMISTAIGVSIGEKRVHAQWDAANAATLESTKAARAGAVRDVARKPSRWLPNHRDPNQRD